MLLMWVFGFLVDVAAVTKTLTPELSRAACMSHAPVYKIYRAPRLVEVMHNA
jgi:hypothetical protein